MNDGSKQKFMKAIFGEDGTSIDTSTAAGVPNECFWLVVKYAWLGD